MLKVVTIVGARPQFIKAAPVSEALAKSDIKEYLVHTGQHYDPEMSAVFFTELKLPDPDIDLGVGSGSHGYQTGQMLIKIEQVLLEQRPDWVLVYGDTNSTLAGALAGVKLHFPVAHVEAGLRSFNRTMPEEHNRVLVDHCADLLFCPTRTAVENLQREGVEKGVKQVGDTMYDAVLHYANMAAQKSTIIARLGLENGSYLLATIHRAYNTDQVGHLQAIFKAFGMVNEKILFPLHPRTQSAIDRHHISISSNVRLIEPVGYLDMLALEQGARLILTDSGGVQKEAYFFAVPCVTLRPETEWVETQQSGWNKVVGTDVSRILQAVNSSDWPKTPPLALFGDGHAAEKIAASLV